jgi:DNA-binding beta-propeller fold protein YncE
VIVKTSNRLAPALAAAALLLAPAQGRAAAAVVVKPVVSVYADDQGLALKGPSGVACNEAGTVVVADHQNHRLVSFTLKGQAVLGGREIKVGPLAWPLAVQLDPKGAMVALDGKTQAIVRVDADGAKGVLVELKGLPDPRAVAPAAIEVDRAGTLWVLDGAGKAVLAVDATDTVVRRIPLPAAKGPFTDVAADPSGTVFVVEPSGGTLWAAAKDATEFKLLNGSLKEAAQFPAAVASDGLGNLFVLDRNGGSVIQLGTDGTYRARHLKLGWAEGELYYPTQLCVGADALVVADRSNERVQVFSIAR